MKIKRPSEKHFSDGLFTIKPFTGPGQQIRCGKTVSQRAFGQGVQADGYSAVRTAGRSREGQATQQGSGMNGPSEKYFSDGSGLSVVPAQTKITADVLKHSNRAATRKF